MSVDLDLTIVGQRADVAELKRMAALPDTRSRDFDCCLDMRYWLDVYVAWWLGELYRLPDDRACVTRIRTHLLGESVWYTPRS